MSYKNCSDFALQNCFNLCLVSRLRGNDSGDTSDREGSKDTAVNNYVMYTIMTGSLSAVAGMTMSVGPTSFKTKVTTCLARWIQRIRLGEKCFVQYHQWYKLLNQFFVRQFQF